MGLFAKDLMCNNLLTLTPDTPLNEAILLFAENNVSGAPVINERGELTGFLSMDDVVSARLELPPYQPGQNPSDAKLTPAPPVQPSSDNVEYVKDYISSNVVLATPETPLEELSRLMLGHWIPWVIITPGDGSLFPQGLISTFDILAQRMTPPPQAGSIC